VDSILLHDYHCIFFKPQTDLSLNLFCQILNCRYDTDEDGLWLHCMRYSGPGWTYECPYPDWAKL